MSRRLTTPPSIPIPTTMRLSVLALFIVLPAAAYAAVTTQHRSTDVEDAECLFGTRCLDDLGCCSDMSCVMSGRIVDRFGVRVTVHFLSFTLGAELNAAMPANAEHDQAGEGDTGMIQVVVMLGSYAFRRRACCSCHPLEKWL